MAEDFERLEWILDGFNVLKVGGLCGTRATWWDQTSRQILLDKMGKFYDKEIALTVVFDGPRAPRKTCTETEDLYRVVFSPSADDWILSQVKRRGKGQPITVVTGDRRLANKVLSKGSKICTPRSFLNLCTAEGLTLPSTAI